LTTADFDRAVDIALERWRRPGTATALAALMSGVSDYGFVWFVLTLVKARRPGPDRRRALQALALTGVVSAVSNALLKQAVGRDRPEPTGAERASDAPQTSIPVRRPRTSSFPSGHTLASFCTATALATGPGELSAYLGLAGAVAISRVHLRAHHASDVVGGALIGTALGCSCRLVLGRVGRVGRVGRSQ
jgi:undecaprenyl-diphosphatase